MMRQFKSLNSFTLTGRGRVDVVALPHPMPRAEVADYVGKEAEIDGVVRAIRGIEMFATLVPIKSVGLLTACRDCGQTTGHYDDCPIGMGVTP